MNSPEHTPSWEQEDELDAVLLAAFADHPFGDEAVESILAGLPPVSQSQSQSDAPAAPSREGGRILRLVIGLGVAAAAFLISATVLRNQEAPRLAPGEIAQGEVREVVGELGPGFMRLGVGADQAGIELSAGSELATGERLVALAPAAELRFRDGTRVAVHADTELELARDADGGLSVRLSGAEGRVFCEVAKQEAPFRVRGEHVAVEVLGTRFVVDQGVRASRVTVVEGRVQVRSSLDIIVATEGDQIEATLATGGHLSQARVTPRRAALWVPALREEQRRLDEEALWRERAHSGQGAASPTPASSRPPSAAPVGSTGLDQPVEPPRPGHSPAPSGPPRED